MQDITDVRAAGDFTAMTVKTAISMLISAALLTTAACNRNNVAENIPTGPVNITIDLNLADYQHLVVPGGFSYFEGGVRGVLLIHDYDDNWYAYERTCAWEPVNTCSKIWVDTQGLQMKCGNQTATGFTRCCESQFFFNGFPSRGPARGPLARYRVSRAGNLLQIYN